MLALIHFRAGDALPLIVSDNSIWGQNAESGGVSIDPEFPELDFGQTAPAQDPVTGRPTDGLMTNPKGDVDGVWSTPEKQEE